MNSREGAAQARSRADAVARRSYGKLVAFLAARGERAEIVHAVLPDVSRFYKLVGGNVSDLQPEKLQGLLRFTVIPDGRGGERLMVVRLVDSSCGAHFNCVA